MLQLFPDQDQTAVIPDQDLDPIVALAAIDDDRARKRIFGQNLLRQGGQAMGTLAEIDRPRR